MENAKNPNSAALGGLANLTKKWDECSVEEKLEKIRNELRELRYGIGRINQVEETIRELQNHEHSESGKMLVPLNTNRGLTGMAQRMDYLA